jgi:type II secretory pathway pseudopilin PulG
MTAPLPTWNLELGTLNSRRLRRARGAYTLAEMLIVVTIMVMLVAITLPTVKRVMEDSGTREASRQLNAYFAMAKARAVQTGRPCGIFMVCEPPLGVTDPAITTPLTWPVRQVTKMFLAEVPPPFCGGTTGARGRIRPSISLITTPTTYSFYPLYSHPTNGWIPDPTEIIILQSLIAPGEEFAVRFDYKGPWFICVRDLVSGEFIYESPTRAGTTQSGSPYPLPAEVNNISTTISGSAYQIVRMPRRIGNPLEMPAGTCIDMVYSGVGPSSTGFYLPGAPATLAYVSSLAVMFSPDGNIDRLYLASKGDMASFVPPTTIHFLIGKIEKLNLPGGTNSTNATGLNMYDPATSNLADPLALWVSVARTSGVVITSDNQPPVVEPGSLSPTNIVLFPGSPQRQVLDPSQGAAQSIYLSYCRQLATNREQAKGQ